MFLLCLHEQNRHVFWTRFQLHFVRFLLRLNCWNNKKLPFFGSKESWYFLVTWGVWICTVQRKHDITWRTKITTWFSGQNQCTKMFCEEILTTLTHMWWNSHVNALFTAKSTTQIAFEEDFLRSAVKLVCGLKLDLNFKRIFCHYIPHFVFPTQCAHKFVQHKQQFYLFCFPIVAFGASHWSLPYWDRLVLNL